MKRYLTIFTLLGIVFCSFGQSEPDRPQVLVSLTSLDIVADGNLDEADWAQASEISNLKTIVPVQGGDPSQRTSVKILANAKYIVFGILCFDATPDAIINFSKLRDTDLSKEDYIKIVIDPFQDGQSGYIFAINANGARYDALVSNRGESESKDWDAIWEANAKIDAGGWSAEIKIPIQSINFKPGLGEWGFNVERNIQRNQEVIRWANVRRDQWFTQTSRAGLITGLPEFDYGVGLNIRPSLILKLNGHAGELRHQGQRALTISKRLGANITAAATFNTDFAETEVDTRRTNLTRFPLFFPEKRAFFLEGSDIFEFGFGLKRDLVPFFSRRIGLLHGDQVPIVAGGKINGRVKRASFGGLVSTGERGGVLGVVRFKQNVLKESSFGFFSSHGDPEAEGPGAAYTSGADFTFQTTRLKGNKNFLVGTWAMYNDGPFVSGDRSAYGLKVDYPNDIWDIAFTYTHIGDGFSPALGFVPRDGINKIVAGGTWGPRPEWKLVRQIRNQVFFTYITDLDWEWQTYRVFTAPINWRFESGERFEFNIVPQGERLLYPFPITQDVTIPDAAYNFVRYRLEGQVAAKRRLNGQVTWWFGEFFNGHLNEYQATINWNPTTIVTFEFSGTRNNADLPTGSFDQTLVGLRVRLNATPDLQLNSFVQYDTDSKNFGLNARMHWIFHPQGDFFIVYNNTANYVSLENRFSQAYSQLLVKLRYNFRL